jgi:serine/threonine protein kinase
MLMQKYIQLNDKYKLLKKIGSGSFGEVYTVLERKTKIIYAGKIEPKSKRSRLNDEYEIYKKLEKHGIDSGIPKMITFIETDKQQILIMELLGESLDQKLDLFGGTFDIGTVLKLGIDIINLLEKIHNAGFIHRDIKPNNFLIGPYENSDKLYIMDFGLSKKYISDGEHIKFKNNKSLVGTARYVSINIHIGIEPSRRDDLEAVGYMLVYFLLGKLPWQGLKKQKNQIKSIGEVKMYTNLSKPSLHIPACLCSYINYCKKLEFDETPNYNDLKNLFLNYSEIMKIKLEYCWNKQPETD